jgi:hypothetical protein
MANFDLNVWDYVGYASEYKEEGWRIDIYECDDIYRHYNSPTKIIYLNETQAKMLTLGIDEDNGGDYCGDADFWIDPQGFLDTYKNIPRKVLRHLEEIGAK